LTPDWLAHARRIRAIAQTGAAYAHDPYDLERYEELKRIAHELIAGLVDATPDRIAAVYLPETGYPTPKVDLRAAVVKDGRILLVKETSDGRWAMPGGWGEEHSAPAATVAREVREESGFGVRVKKLIALKDRHLHPYRPARLERVYKLIFLCELTGGEPRTSIETSAVGFFDPDDLPELSTGRTLAADVRLAMDHHRAPDMLPYFD
jgi:ADP-ribose pyrophosphatase YjhB (NUDIX family)